ncbi:MAG: hypothetical protein PHU88_05795 [candidate division Zixibacteria bacterium]|nr:hypothetical protein [candidate division Zixibacteria bacterium]MDD5427421.1 hypothetical protein [candidate division Zixibacteria bacterium]
MKTKMTWKKILLLVLVVVAILLTYFLYPPAYPEITFPEGKKFAFTIVDDTDNATLANIKGIYDFLYEQGFRTTKTVWVFPTNDTSEWANLGASLEDSAYQAFVLDLQNKGFEIALHGARGGSSKRSEIITALEKYKETFGDYPKIHINHALNTDNLYWGRDKFSFAPFKYLYGGIFSNKEYYGHVPGSEYFWGDLAQQYITYVVNLSFFDINLLKINPSLPYHDPDKPYVRYWFHTSDGGYVTSFNELIKKKNIDRLEKEGGVCLVYTHLARDFYLNNTLDTTFKRQMEYLATKDGWFVPASVILDFLRLQPGDGKELSFREKVRLEILWLYEKILHGSS